MARVYAFTDVYARERSISEGKLYWVINFMSVILETSVGDLTIDLLVEEAPLICENFLKLCKVINHMHYIPFCTRIPSFWVMRQNVCMYASICMYT